MDQRTICQQHSDVYHSKLVQMIPIKFHWFSMSEASENPLRSENYQHTNCPKDGVRHEINKIQSGT